MSRVETGRQFPTDDELPKWIKAYRCKSAKQFRMRWAAGKQEQEMNGGFKLPLWQFARPEWEHMPIKELAVGGRLEGLTATIYDEAKLIGEAEQQRRRA